MRRAALVVALALAAPAGAQDLLNGWLFGPDPTKESHEEDARIRELATERDWVIHVNLHPAKRSYANLKKHHRAAYRALAQRLVKAYWARGTMNDALRAFDALEGPHIFQESVDHDPCGEDPTPCETRTERDPEVKLEDRALASWLASHPAGERLIPVSNEEHLTFQERMKYPHVGLGQQRIGFASDNEDLVRDRVLRHFKWGPYKDEEHWKIKLEGLKRSFGSRLQSVVVLMANVPRFEKRTEELVQNKLGDKTWFARKNEIYQAVLRTQGGTAQIEEAIRLVVDGEVLAARLARGDTRASDIPGRNQMSGMALVIAGAATAYLESPTYGTLMRLGGAGALGARGAPVAR